MFDTKWSPGEKKVAHAAFEAALSRERAAIRRHIEAMLSVSAEGPEIWAIRDYLNEKAREFDHKYDFRYSVLIDVFARLLAEGWLTLDELAGLDTSKLELVRNRSAMWKVNDA